MSYDFDITEYGAVPDGETMNTAAIQKAINSCSEAGGGRVVCGPGNFLTGALHLRSNIELHLMTGCKLIGSTDLNDYMDLDADGFITAKSPEGNSYSLLLGADLENVAITGSGEINGSGQAFYDTVNMTSRFFSKPKTARPRILTLYNCHDIRIEDAAFIDSACWTFWLMKCERVNIHRIRVISDQRMINSDGIDIDACRDVTISDCIIKTGDDCIILRSINAVFETPGVCENVTVTNCVLDSWCQGVRVGCPADGTIKNCTFSNLVINSIHNGILFEYPKRYIPDTDEGTADIHHVTFSNIVINCALFPVQLIVDDGITLPRISDISFSNMQIKSGEPCVVKGSPETIIRDIRFTGVTIETDGKDAILCRNCERVTLTDVTLSNHA